ncbi:hypothetical protein [Afifella aestuarii]|uniref:hypothetical protein n=1 Tax=Afifella aestuarii TaxID=1909496 RepID=UPI000FE3302C|nr:hypothetical protein [Afifella aestuarii]
MRKPSFEGSRAFGIHAVTSGMNELYTMKGNFTTDVTQAISLISDVHLPAPSEWIEWRSSGHWVHYPVFGYEGEIVGEGFIDTDFLDTVVRFFGGRRDRARIWRVLGMSVTWRDSVGIVGHESGWRRYHLGSIDGVVRQLDHQAPVVMLTPRGQVLFQESPRHKVRAVNDVGAVAEIVAAFCPHGAEVVA